MEQSGTDIIPFTFKTKQVRTIKLESEIWFVADDVAKALNYLEAKDMTRILDADEKGRHIVPTLGGMQEVLTINESGLYHAVLKSRKPEAKPFRKWVTSEVLPTIRKTGRYELPQSPYLTPEQRAAIKATVASRVATLPKAQQKGGYPQLYSAMNGRFGAPKYEFIRAEHFDAAMAFIGSYYFPALESTFNPEERAVNAARGAHEKGASRYLVAFNEDGRIRQVRPVEDGATVVSPTIESVYTYLREDLPYEAIPAALQMIAMRASNRMYYGAKGAPMPEWARSA